MDRATTTIVRVVTDVELSGKTCQAKPSAFPTGIFVRTTYLIILLLTFAFAGQENY
jgi:hypothetical protein